MKKHIASHVYSQRDLPDGGQVLYAKDRFKTKLTPEDLPPWFYRCYRYGRYYYIDAKNVRQMIYRPTYWVNNHLFRDDALYVSFGSEIRMVRYERGFEYMEGADHLFWGGHIVHFLVHVMRYSDYDITPIQLQLYDKYDWFVENNPDHPQAKPDVRTYFTSAFIH